MPLTTLAQSSAPAAGAPILQVLAAGAFFTVATLAVLWLVDSHRKRRTGPLGGLLAWGGGIAERVSGIPGWSSLPAFIAGIALASAMIGVYWDIGIHAENGRDEGPLATLAHYPILIGLFGIFAAGLLAIAMPRDGDAGPAPIRLPMGWTAPVGGILILASATVGMLGFPLDDLWHRLFGQDVTLWGATHVMMIAGAVLTLVGIAVLHAEATAGRDIGGLFRGRMIKPIRMLIAGALLVGAGVFLAEFDWGIPQFRQVWHPLLLAASGAFALVLGRTWAGRGGAIGALAFYLVLRGATQLLVGGVFEPDAPAMSIFLVEALLIEAIAWRRDPADRPVVIGAAAGLACGTVGFAAQYAWSLLVMPLPWTAALIPEGLASAALAGVAGGMIGALLGAGLLLRLPPPRTVRVAAVGSAIVLVALGINAAHHSESEQVRAEIQVTETSPSPGREGTFEVGFDPASAAESPHWVAALSWQGGGLEVDRFEEAGPATWRSTRPLPIDGPWKTIIRLHDGRALNGVLFHAPPDPEIDFAGVALPDRAGETMVYEQEILQLERDFGVPGWIWAAGNVTVLSIVLMLCIALALGLARVARAQPPSSRPPSPPAPSMPGARSRVPVAG